MMNPALELTQQIIATLTQGGGAISSVVSAATGIQSFLETPKSKRESELQAKVNVLCAEIGNAQIANLELQKQVLALKLALEEAQRPQGYREAYEFHTTPAGHVVCRLKQPESEAEAERYACPVCLDEGRRSILQGGEAAKSCPRCKARFRFKPAQGRAPRGRQPGWMKRGAME